MVCNRVSARTRSGSKDEKRDCCCVFILGFKCGSLSEDVG